MKKSKDYAVFFRVQLLLDNTGKCTRFPDDCVKTQKLLYMETIIKINGYCGSLPIVF